MPPELCQTVFDWLKSRDLIRLTHVSKWWRARVLGLLRHYRLRSDRADHVQSVLVFSWLLQQQNLPPPQMKAKKKAKSNTKEKKNGGEGKLLGAGEATLAVLMERMADECPRLRSLDLSLVKGPAAHLAAAMLCLPPTLTSLRLAYCGLEDTGNLDQLHRVVPNLTRLDVSHCGRLSNAALASGLPEGLLSLKARGCRGLDNSLYGALPASLTELDLSKCDGITWACDGSALPRGLRLLKLSLKRDDPQHRSLQPAFGFGSLAWDYYVRKPRALTGLPEGLQICMISESSAMFGSSLSLLPRRLEHLRLKNCSGLCAEALKHLPTRLRSLDLTGSTGVTDPDLTHLTSLEELHLDQWRLYQNTTGTLLRGLPDSLRVLTMRLSAAISDKDFDNVPLGLQVLDVWGCDNVSPELVLELAADLKSIRLPSGKWHHRSSRLGEP